MSGDSNGELHDQVVPQKSYSLGITIVSGCDARIRRNVIERIVSDSTAGRVVVVTTSGITSTDDPDAQIASSAQDAAFREDAESDPDSQAAANLPDSSREKLNGFASTSASIEQLSQPPSSVNKLEGWIACSSADEMAEVIAKLSASRGCDYIIAEGPGDGTVEPQQLAQLLHSRGGASLRVDTLVSVIDGDTLLQDLSALPAPAEEADTTAVEVPHTDSTFSSPERMQDPTDTRPMMVANLVENANVIVVNQNAEGAQQDQRSRVLNLVSVLNDSASIVSATDDNVPVDRLVNTNSYDNETVSLGATWRKVLVASRNANKGLPPKPGLPKVLKEAAFVYRAKRPFHPTRLYEHIKAVATFEGVVRSTGRIWLATRMLAPLEWNQAGVAATLRVGKLFWAAVPEAEWPTNDGEREKIMQNWDTRYGDRETEMVFVGMGIDKVRLQGLLDGCLLQDEEMVFTNMWENFEDPFVEWVPLIDDDEEPVSENNIASSSELHPLTESQVISPPAQDEQVEDIPSEAAGQGQGDLPCNGAEGMIRAESLPDNVMEQVSALNIFEKGFDDDSSASFSAQPRDDGAYNEDQAVIASWDGDVADGILVQMPKSGLPVTIVTGFLGSGKTTLLNYILTADHGLRIAVLVNEFGEIDIDNQLVEKGDWSSEDEVMELANGCICCSINDSFVNAVSKILERRDSIDYLIVETTGVADPVPVINSLMVSDVADNVRVDGILTLVDAENFNPDTHMGSEAALSQIMAADTILMSKTDLVAKERVDRTIKYIKSVRPAARILRSQRGRVPINLILDVGVRLSDSPAHMNPVKKSLVEEEKVETHAQDHAHSHGHEHKHEEEGHGHECGSDCTHESHAHDHSHENHLELDGFVTTSFKSDTALDPDLFMNKFLQKLPEGVFRAKGLLRFYGYDRRYIFQLSGRRYEFAEDTWPEDVAPGNQIVIIGRDLDLESLRETLESCLVLDDQDCP